MSTPDPRAEAELAAAFTRVHLGLAEADTDDAVLRAVAHAVVSHGPHALRLYTLHDDIDALPSTAELASVWQAGICPAEDPLLGRRFAVGDHPVLARWLAAPTRPLVLHDLAADPRAHDRSTQALVVLPLRGGDAWLGALVLSWPIEHTPSPRERAVYDLIARAVSASLAARRALQRHQHAVDEANTLHVAAAALAEAASLDDVHAALAEPAQAAGATWTALWACVRDDGGRLHRVAPAPAPGDSPPRPLAELADLFARPHEPCLFDQVDPDSLDPGARLAEVRAGLRLPLAVAGRPVGLLELGWPTPRSVPSELQHLYAALDELAATALVSRAALVDLAVDDGAHGTVEFTAGAPAEHDEVAGRLLAAHPELATALTAAFAEASAAKAIVRRTAELGDVTLELLVAADELPGEGVAVLQDISSERRAEAERLRARDALLAAQTALLARQTVPVLPLSDAAVAVPLLGPIDVDRAAQLRDTAAGLGAPVRAAIVDLTNVPAIDPAAAAALADVAATLRARGVEPVFTGIRPELGLGDLPARGLGDALGAALLARP